MATLHPLPVIACMLLLPACSWYKSYVQVPTQTVLEVSTQPNAHCQDLGLVQGDSIYGQRFGYVGEKEARDIALSQASSLGATHIIWLEHTDGSNAPDITASVGDKLDDGPGRGMTVFGQALRCDDPITNNDTTEAKARQRATQQHLNDVLQSSTPTEASLPERLPGSSDLKLPPDPFLKSGQ